MEYLDLVSKEKDLMYQLVISFQSKSCVQRRIFGKDVWCYIRNRILHIPNSNGSMKEIPVCYSRKVLWSRPDAIL